MCLSTSNQNRYYSEGLVCPDLSMPHISLVFSLDTQTSETAGFCYGLDAKPCVEACIPGDGTLERGVALKGILRTQPPALCFPGGIK